MNLFLKQKFLIEAWQFNQTFNPPFNIFHKKVEAWYQRADSIVFKPFSENEKSYLVNNFSSYQQLIETKFNLSSTNKNERKDITIVMPQSFLQPYFKHFFLSYPEEQINLLKHFHQLVHHEQSTYEFLKQIEPTLASNLLSQAHLWESYRTEKLTLIHDMMNTLKFDEKSKVTTIHKFVEHYLKNINKSPLLSKELETFLEQHYFTKKDIIAKNVVAIQKRKEAVNQDDFFKSFKNQTVFTLKEAIDFSQILKTFQISGWREGDYKSLVRVYHQYLEKLEFKTYEVPATNDKNMEIFITMKTDEFNLHHYHENLFSLFSFYRNYPDANIDNYIVQSVINEAKLQKQLNLTDTSNKEKRTRKI